MECTSITLLISAYNTHYVSLHVMQGMSPVTSILFRNEVSLSWHDSFSDIRGKYLLLTDHIWAPRWGILLEPLCFPTLSVSSRLAVFNGKNLITGVWFVGNVVNVDCVFYITNICSVLFSNWMLLEEDWMFRPWPCFFSIIAKFEM